MVGTVAFLSVPSVNDGGQIGKVSVQVDVLGVVSAQIKTAKLKNYTNRSNFESRFSMRI